MNCKKFSAKIKQRKIQVIEFNVFSDKQIQINKIKFADKLSGNLRSNRVFFKTE